MPSVLPSPTRSATDLATAHWQTASHARHGSIARAERADPGLRLRLGDLAHPSPRQLAAGLTGDSLLLADFAAEGTVRVQTWCAPPALLLSRQAVSLFPADGGSSADATLDAGDILVICSAAMLETGAARLVTLLQQDGSPIRLAADPRRLLDELLDGSTAGAAAVVRRLDPTVDSRVVAPVLRVGA